MVDEYPEDIKSATINSKSFFPALQLLYTANISSNSRGVYLDC